MTVLDNLLALQVWQGEDIDEAIEYARQVGVNSLLWKALDGGMFMGAIDPWGIDNVAEASDWRARCAAVGLTFGVWTVPLPEYVPDQATKTGQLLAAVDYLALDVEPYAQFWGPNHPEAMGQELLDLIRAGGGDKPLILQPDPRRARMAEIGRAWYDDFGSDVDAVAPQIYWPDFGWSVEEAVAYIREYAWPRPVIPTVPLTAPPEEVAHFVSELAGVVRSFILWRWHSGYPESIVAAAASFRPPDLVEPTGPGLDTPEGAAAYAGLTGIYNGATGTAGVLPSAPDQADLSAIIERMQRIKARHGYAP